MTREAFPPPPDPDSGVWRDDRPPSSYRTPGRLFDPPGPHRTPTESRTATATNRAAQVTMFDLPAETDTAPATCPACAGDLDAGTCPRCERAGHVAPTLDLIP